MHRTECTGWNAQDGIRTMESAQWNPHHGIRTMDGTRIIEPNLHMKPLRRNPHDGIHTMESAQWNPHEGISIKEFAQRNLHKGICTKYKGICAMLGIFVYLGVGYECGAPASRSTYMPAGRYILIHFTLAGVVKYLGYTDCWGVPAEHIQFRIADLEAAQQNPRWCGQVFGLYRLWRQNISNYGSQTWKQLCKTLAGVVKYFGYIDCWGVPAEHIQ